MENKKTYLLALFSAFLLWLGWPPIPYTAPLLLVALVPLLIAFNRIKEQASLNQAHGDTRIGKSVFLTAGLTFLVWNTASIYWVYNAISAVNNPLVAAVVSLIPFGLGALLMTFAFWLYYRLSRVVNKWIAYLGFVSFYIAMEYLHQTWDLAFPWMTLGNGLAGMHQLAQWYEYTGVYGGSAWILASNILAWEAYRSLKTGAKGYSRLKPVLVWALLVILPAGISLMKYVQYQEKALPVNVVVVQPNIDPYEKFGSLPSSVQLNILMHLSDSVAQPNTEYFIWPETAMPNHADEDRIRSNGDFINAQSFLEKYKNGSIISGIESIKFYNGKQSQTARHAGDNIYADTFNAAVQIENSANVQFYHKSKLVPGVEQMPFPAALSVLGPVFQGFGGTVGGYGWQEKPSVFYSYSGIGVSPVICYESIWGDWTGKAVKEGAQMIAVVTNDGWWGNTSGKDQHLLYAKLRAVETRRWVARSANTGISAFINQKGDIVQQSKWWTRTALKQDVNLNSDLTFYVRNGDWPAKLFTAMALLLVMLIPYHKWRSKRAPAAKA
jgi:apolipoprotein N-acyltransferase